MPGIDLIRQHHAGVVDQFTDPYVTITLRYKDGDDDWREQRHDARNCFTSPTTASASGTVPRSSLAPGASISDRELDVQLNGQGISYGQRLRSRPASPSWCATEPDIKTMP